MKYQDLSSFSVPEGFRGRSAFWVQLWWIVQFTLFSWSPQIFYLFRVWLLRLFGARVGRGVLIRPSARITYPWKLVIGDHVWIGDDSVIYNLADISIGSNVAIAHRVYLCTGLHDITKLTFDIEARPIVIEDEVWLPNDVYVGPGVSIGMGTVVAARSSVFDDLPGGVVAAGTPARIIRDRMPESIAAVSER